MTHHFRHLQLQRPDVELRGDDLVVLLVLHHHVSLPPQGRDPRQGAHHLLALLIVADGPGAPLVLVPVPLLGLVSAPALPSVLGFLLLLLLALLLPQLLLLLLGGLPLRLLGSLLLLLSLLGLLILLPASRRSVPRLILVSSLRFAGSGLELVLSEDSLTLTIIIIILAVSFPLVQTPPRRLLLLLPVVEVEGHGVHHLGAQSSVHPPVDGVDVVVEPAHLVLSGLHLGLGVLHDLIIRSLVSLVSLVSDIRQVTVLIIDVQLSGAS